MRLFFISILSLFFQPVFAQKVSCVNGVCQYSGDCSAYKKMSASDFKKAVNKSSKAAMLDVVQGNETRNPVYYVHYTADVKKEILDSCSDQVESVEFPANPAMDCTGGKDFTVSVGTYRISNRSALMDCGKKAVQKALENPHPELTFEEDYGNLLKQTAIVAEANLKAIEKKMDPNNPRTKLYADDVNPAKNATARALFEKQKTFLGEGQSPRKTYDFDSFIETQNWMALCQHRLLRLSKVVDAEQKRSVDMLLRQVENEVSQDGIELFNKTKDQKARDGIGARRQLLVQSCQRGLARLEFEASPNAGELSECFMEAIDRFTLRGGKIDPYRPTQGKAFSDALNKHVSSRHTEKESQDPIDVETNRVTESLMKFIGWDYDDKFTTVDKPVKGDRANQLISPWKLFEEALAGANGNIYVAIRAAYNVTREIRLHPMLCRKFMNISGGEPESNDNCGNIYHMFGLMKIRYLGEFYSDMAIVLDTGDDDPKEVEYNCAGLNTMTSMMKKIDERTYEIVGEKGRHYVPRNKSWSDLKCDETKAFGMRPMQRTQKKIDISGATDYKPKTQSTTLEKVKRDCGKFVRQGSGSVTTPPEVRSKK